MALTPAQLQAAAYVPAAAAPQFTATSVSYIRTIILHNTDAAPRVVTLWNVPNGGAAGGANQFVLVTLAAYQTGTYEWKPPGIVMGTVGDYIEGKADVGNKVTIQMYGFTT